MENWCYESEALALFATITNNEIIPISSKNQGKL
jgi:hypothetical protein